MGKCERVGDAEVCKREMGEFVRYSVGREDLLRPSARSSLLSPNLCQLLSGRH